MKAIILDMYGVIVKQTGDEFVSERVCSRPIGCLGKHIILSWCGSCDIAIPFIRGLKSGESGLCKCGQRFHHQKYTGLSLIRLRNHRQ